MIDAAQGWAGTAHCKLMLLLCGQSLVFVLLPPSYNVELNRLIVFLFR